MTEYLNVLERNGLHPLSEDRGIRPNEFIKDETYNPYEVLIVGITMLCVGIAVGYYAM